MIPGLVSLALGAFRFALLRESYDAVSHKLDLRWSAVDRAGGRPAHHAAGVGAETLTLSGVIFPAFHGTMRFPQAMRAAASAMTPQLMIDGNGFFWGYWVATSVSEGASRHMADGAPRRQEWTLELERYTGPAAGGGIGGEGGALGAVQDAADGLSDAASSIGEFIS